MSANIDQRLSKRPRQLNTFEYNYTGKLIVPNPITDMIGKLPYAMAFAGRWIDQSFPSRLNRPRPVR
jgi:hypothetical protein